MLYAYITDLSVIGYNDHRFTLRRALIQIQYKWERFKAAFSRYIRDPLTNLLIDAAFKRYHVYQCKHSVKRVKR